MGKGSRKRRTHLTDLPDELLNLIFKTLESNPDKESFGLSCHRFLNIQNSSCNVLDINEVNSLSHQLKSFMLHRLLNRFRQLESLSLAGCGHVTDSGLVLLEKYGFKLRSIRLQCCKRLTNVGFSSIASGCPSLSVLNLFYTSIEDSGLEILTKSCNSLKEVSLGWCNNITDGGIRSLTRNCRQLRSLRITGCIKIHGKGFEGCSSTLACLEADNCDFALGLTEMLSGGGLEYLNLAWNREIIWGYGLDAIGSGVAANLKILNLMGCRYVRDAVIRSISKGCPLLQEWNLICCENITISGWESIGLYCRNLERIHVTKCLKFCDRGLLALGNGCGRLSVIYMQNCQLITQSGIQLFRIQRKDVEINEQQFAVSIVPSWWHSIETPPRYRM